MAIVLLWRLTFFDATSTSTSEAQKASAAAVNPSSNVSVLYSLMGGQDLAPHTKAKWMRGSTGTTIYTHTPTRQTRLGRQREMCCRVGNQQPLL